MARNGSGGYSLPVNTWNPATNGVSATAADWQALINDVAAAVQQSISADGQTPVTGSLNMGGNRLTSLAAGTATGHSLRFEQLFSQGLSADVAAATTVDIGAQLSTLINVTGTGTITSFGTNYNGPRFLRFAGVCTLTNGASLVLPGGANITTAAGDSAIAVPLGNPATGWRVLSFDKADGGLVNVTSINGGQLAGLRNKIINGKMEIAQRGTSFASAASDYTLDRWTYSRLTSSANVTITQQADAPSNNEFQNSLRVAVTAADTTIVAGDYSFVMQRIEGYNARDLIGKTFTLSFWVRSSKTGTHCVTLRNSGVDRSYAAEYTINAANTWEYKTITVSGGLITAGTWNWTNGPGLDVIFALATSSTFQTTAGAWQTGNFLATANQVNCLDTIGNIFAITGVQLEVGSVATPFEHRPFGMELALAQRFYSKSYLLSQVPGTASANGYSTVVCAGTATQLFGNTKLPVTMRTTPTVNVFSFAGTGAAWSTTGGADIGTVATFGGNDSYLTSGSSGAGLTVGNTYLFHWVASAEL